MCKRRSCSNTSWFWSPSCKTKFCPKLVNNFGLAMAATASDIEEFLSGPLVTWLGTCLKRPESLKVYETFYDGAPISEVLLQIDPEPAQPVPTLTNLQGLSIVASRIKIFHCIVKNVKNIYEQELGQVVISMPDCVAIGRAPGSQDALQQLKLLMLLLLGCAVQGPTKELFITRIKLLTLETQHDIVECIKRVTDGQTIVLTQDWPEQSLQNIYTHLRTLAGERDVLFQCWVNDLGQDLPAVAIDKDGFESNHLAVELADWKARLRKQRQELEEKTEILTECKEELEHTTSLVVKLKAENADLLTESRKAKAYRDEADAIRERAERADKLEAEVQRYQERLADTDFYRVRVSELREDNRVLLETREMLEAQLARSRQRADHVLELEVEMLQLKQTINDITLEREADKERMVELIDENVQLQQVAKQVLQETTAASLLDSDLEEANSGDNSLSEQLTNNAQARALKLELENRKLMSTIDALKETSFHESSNRVLELEKEKKKLEIKQEQSVENFERLRQQNRELDELFKESIQENRKLQGTLDANKLITDKLTLDIHNEHVKIEELERNVDALTKEKQRVQILAENIRKRADCAEKSLALVNEQLEQGQEAAQMAKRHKCEAEELQEKLAHADKELAAGHKEIAKLKELIEVKDRHIDGQLAQDALKHRELQKAQRDVNELSLQLEKQFDCEQKLQELESQHAISTVTIDNLQKDLISHKVSTEKCRRLLEKLGLSFELLDQDVNVLLEKVFSNQDLVRVFVHPSTDEQAEELTISEADALEKLQQTNEALENDNAKLQVDISTLTSKVNSLQMQQTALQLANSQLVAEKDELSKLNAAHICKHDTLLHDQVTIRTLYEQLNAEYEELLRDQESVKKIGRDLRIEVRTLNEQNTAHEKRISSLELEKEALKNESKSLGNLRTEHSKLKEDFRNLFTANERVKMEYKALQEENKGLKRESWRLRVGNSEMQGELTTRGDVLGNLQVENAKLRQHCDILLDMNRNLDADRRALMNHVSKLLSQYHSLLMHSLEDKQHYHMEEKHFTDKLNNLCRQKEKLEEKIMEHYRKLDNASGKKRGTIATIARRMRKATEALNKIPNRNRRSWQEDTVRLTQSGDSGGNDSDSTAEEKPLEAFKRGSSAASNLKPRDEVPMRRSHRESASHRNSIAGDQVGPVSLGAVGTRRTVYLSEDDHNASTAGAQSSQAPANNANPPLLVYNRISTVIGGQAAPNHPSDEPEKASKEGGNSVPSTETRNAENNAKENAIWYEYGCV